MTTRWQQLAGDTDVFAMKIAFAPDPDEGRAIDSDVSASWGRFQIWVGGRNLCAHQEENERITSVHWYLLPLMEWFVQHWDPIFHEERLPVKNDGTFAWESLRSTRFPPRAIENDKQKVLKWERTWQAWWTRHALRAAREGGLFPDVLFRRFRDSVEVSWGPVRGKGTPYHFGFGEAPGGADRLRPQAVAEPLHDVLSDASEYLLKLTEGSRRVKALHKGLQKLKDVSTHREKRVMWMAGLGASEPAVRNGWRRAMDSLSALPEVPRQAFLKVSDSPLVVASFSQAALMFATLAPGVKAEDVLSLAQIAAHLYKNETGAEKIHTVAGTVQIEDPLSPPWLQGYELAEALHERFEAQYVDDDSVNIQNLVEALGVEVMDVDISDGKIRGIAIAGPQHRPGIVVNSNHAANVYAAGRRFTLAHELCHLLFDQKDGNRLAIASGPWAPTESEQRADAFAAMLLMPTFLVQGAVAKLTEPLKTAKGLSEIVHRLNVARSSVLRHLRNLGYIDEVDQQLIEDDFHPLLRDSCYRLTAEFL